MSFGRDALIQLCNALPESHHTLKESISQYCLALLLEKGLGVEANPTVTRQWLEQAAHAGVAIAQYEYAQGFMHQHHFQEAAK